MITRRVGGEGALATVLGTLLAQTLLNLLALTILAVIVLTGSPLRIGHGAAAPMLVAALALIMLCVFAAPRALSSRPPERGWLRRARHWLGLQLVLVRQGLSVFRRLRSALHSVTFQLDGWALQLSCCVSALYALGLGRTAGVTAAAAALFALNVTAVIPVTPSNVGIFQAACIGALVPFGVSPEQALAYGLVLQGIEVVTALTLGLPALLQEGLSLAASRRPLPTGSPSN